MPGRKIVGETSRDEGREFVPVVVINSKKCLSLDSENEGGKGERKVRRKLG